jgi:hypothetical protein
MNLSNLRKSRFNRASGRTWWRALASLWALVFVVVMFACETFDGPPEPAIEGLSAGVLADPSLPFEVSFSKPIELSTLNLKIVNLDLDEEGNLPDERGNPDLEMKPLFEYTGGDGREFGGTLEAIKVGEELRRVKIVTRARLPVAAKLALLIEPGLKQAGGKGLELKTRVRVPFAYDFKCSGKGTKVMKSGAYFLLLNVEKPIGTQIQLFGWLDIDAASGQIRGQFTNADRLMDVNRCPGLGCKAGVDACQTLPERKCVAPSERAITMDDFPDFEVNPTPPTGYGFSVPGCAEDIDDTTAAFATAPANLVVQQPAVSVRGLTIVAQWKAGPDGVLRATGNGNGEDVLLGTGALGPASGTIVARTLSEAEAPKNIPRP